MRKHKHKLTMMVALATVAITGGVGGYGYAAPEVPIKGHTNIDGVVVRVAEEGLQIGAAHEEAEEMRTVLRLADGSSVPIEGAGLDHIPTGTKLKATVDVPATVAAGARAGWSITNDAGRRVDLNRADLADASDGTPTAEGSDMSVAAAASSVSTGNALQATSLRVLKAPAAATNNRRVHDLVYAVVVPKGVSGPVATPAQIRAQVEGASRYWSDEARGAISLRVASISTPYYSSFDCSEPFRMWQEAAARTGFTEAPGRHLVMSFPRSATSAGCSYGLAGYGTGADSGGVALVSDVTWPVLAHEIGHNFGLGHAKALVCARGDAKLSALPAGCRINEYGYPWSVMAASAPDRAGNISSAQATLSGLMPASDVVAVTSGSRVVTLKPYGGGAGTGTRAVRVIDPISREQYFVEYRVKVGRDAKLYVNLKDGVRIINVDDTVKEAIAEVVLDTSPTGRVTDQDRQLDPGRTFTSYTGGFSVTTKSVGKTATVVVTVGGAGPRLGSSAAHPGRVSVAAPVVDALAAASPSATVRWAGAAPGSVYDVRYRSVGTDAAGKPVYGAETAWLSGTTSTSSVLRAATGAVYQVSARARSASSTGEWSPWRTVTFANDAALRGASLVGRWQQGRGAGYYAGTFLATSVAKAAWSRTSSPTNRIDIVGPRHVEGAKALVYVDGKLRATIDTYAPRTVARSVLASLAVPFGQHTVRVVNAPAATRPTLVLDAVAFAR